MSKALEAAVKAAGMEGWDHIDDRMKAAITAFLDAAAGDEEVSRAVDVAFWLRIDGAEPPTHLNAEPAKAAILALKDAGNG
jgi:hypothetical protein